MTNTIIEGIVNAALSLKPGMPTPGPWEYVPGNEAHGPYVTSDYGSTICDCYLMSNPNDWSVLNGGTSRPVPFMAEMAEPNARLIAAAPEMLAALREILNFREGKGQYNFSILPTDQRCNEYWDCWQKIEEVARAAVAKAEGPQS